MFKEPFVRELMQFLNFVKAVKRDSVISTDLSTVMLNYGICAILQKAFERTYFLSLGTVRGTVVPTSGDPPSWDSTPGHRTRQTPYYWFEWNATIEV